MLEEHPMESKERFAHCTQERIVGRLVRADVNRSFVCKFTVLEDG